MKIRHPLLIGFIGFVGALVIRVWIGTLRCRQIMGTMVDPRPPGLTEKFIYAFWHENLLLLAQRYRNCGINILISQHADGEMIARTCNWLGFKPVRGSTTRGAAQAIRQMVHSSAGGHLALTPDGPRGPRRRLQLGVVYLAARTGMPIVLAGIAYDRPWRLGSWDRFALPRPFSKVFLVTAAPIHVPADLDRDQLEAMQTRIQQELDRLQDEAERLAIGRKAGQDSEAAPPRRRAG